MSKFKLSPRFPTSVNRLKRGIQRAAEIGANAAKRRIEPDARALARWRDEGTYTETDAGGDTWTWTVTGTAERTITAIVTTPEGGSSSLPFVNGGWTTITRTSADGFTRQYAHSHMSNAGLVSRPVAQPNEVRITVTMYVEYARWLQKKEIEGSSWGAPSAGVPVTQEVLDVYWREYYVPSIIRPAMEKHMASVAASLR